jgi:hypothetical protein
MMQKLYALCILLAFCVADISAQISKIDTADLRIIKAYEDTIRWLGKTIVENDDWNQREAAVGKMIPMLVKALKVENSYYYPFDSLLTVRIIKPADDAFRIFTWQMTMKDQSHRYYGAIQMKGSTLQLHPLIDMSLFIPLPEDTILDANNWWGCIYYNVVQWKVKKTKENYYLLFGWDANDFFSNKKVVDVLWFDDNGKPWLGKPVFNIDDTEYRSRVILEYKEDANPTLNFDEGLNMIVFDYLRPENPLSEGIYSTYIPDGTYQGFSFENGYWKLQRVVFDYEMDVAPVYKPKYEGNDPNIYIKKEKEENR